MIETINIQGSERMMTEIGTRHADDAHKEQQITNAMFLGHGVATIGFHVNSIRQSLYRNVLILYLASPLTTGLGLGLGLGSGERFALVQDQFHSMLI
jgi:hypothetical protein